VIGINRGIGLGLGVARAGGAAGNGLLNNLVAYWPLNEAGGANNALDLHTNGLTLTQGNSPGSAAGIVYSGARTFGANKRFTRADEELLRGGAGSFGFAAWAYRNSDLNNVGIFGKYNTEPAEYYMALYSVTPPNYLRFRVGTPQNAVTVIATETVPVATWFLVLGWYDQVIGKTYIQINNGTVYASTNTSTNGCIPQNYPFLLGDYYGESGGEVWNGRIGPVAMWKSAPGAGGVLSAAHRTALWNDGAGLAYANFTT